MALGVIYGFLCGDSEGIPVESVLGLLFGQSPSPVAASPLFQSRRGGTPPVLCLTLPHGETVALTCPSPSPRITPITSGFL